MYGGLQHPSSVAFVGCKRYQPFQKTWKKVLSTQFRSLLHYGIFRQEKGVMRNDAADSSKATTGKVHTTEEEYELARLKTAISRPAPVRLLPSAPANVPSEAQNIVRHHGRVRTWLSRQFGLHHVPLSAARDHLANERVFLAYIRTGTALANFAVVVLQLYRLKHNPVPKEKLTDYDLGSPLATATLVIAMAITLAGTWRFFICQNAMAKKKQMITSGNVVMIFIPILILVSFLHRKVGTCSTENQC